VRDLIRRVCASQMQLMSHLRWVETFGMRGRCGLWLSGGCRERVGEELGNERQALGIVSSTSET